MVNLSDPNNPSQVYDPSGGIRQQGDRNQAALGKFPAGGYQGTLWHLPAKHHDRGIFRNHRDSDLLHIGRLWFCPVPFEVHANFIFLLLIHHHAAPASYVDSNIHRV